MDGPVASLVDGARRSFEMVKKFVDRDDEAGHGTEQDIKSSVVFDLAYQEFEKVIDKDPLFSKVLVWYARCLYWNTRYCDTGAPMRSLEERADTLFNQALKGHSMPAEDVHEAWAFALFEESSARHDWRRSAFLQAALDNVQKCYQLAPDSTAKYSTAFHTWHRFLVEQQKELVGTADGV